MSKASHKRLLELDALRGIAAIGVVVFHMTMGTKQETLLSNYGLTGVDLFFMISGFVILMTLKSITTPRQFIVGRFIRLYPLYWIALIISAASFVIVGHVAINTGFINKFVANLTMLQPFLLQSHMDGVYWTLVVEMLFYVVMLSLFYFKKLDKIELIGFICLFPLLIYGTYISHHIGIWSVRISRFMPLANYLPLFLSGVVYFNLKFDAKTRFRYIILIMCFITQVPLFYLNPERARWFNAYAYITPILVYNALFLLYSFDKLNFIANPVTVFLGKISYPIYLLHNSVIRLVAGIGVVALSFWPRLVVVIGLIILVSYLLHRFIEKPILTYSKKKWLSKDVPVKGSTQEDPAKLKAV